MATVDFGGVRKEVCLAYVPDAGRRLHDRARRGLALIQPRRGSALETPELFKSVGLLDEELASRWTRREVSRRVR